MLSQSLDKCTARNGGLSTDMDASSGLGSTQPGASATDAAGSNPVNGGN